MKIVCQSSGQLCGPGEVGEIWVKTDCMMLGYVNASTDGLYDDDGFFKSTSRKYLSSGKPEIWPAECGRVVITWQTPIKLGWVRGILVNLGAAKVLARVRQWAMVLVDCC